MRKALVTGAAGLVGSETVRFLAQRDFAVIGIDNDMRQYFFGADGSTDWNRRALEAAYPKQYTHYAVDIRDPDAVATIFQRGPFEIIVHTAAQPSHDWAAREPLTDFSINATGTLVMLEHFRLHSPEATFIFTSTNKVYGDSPNLLPLVELDKRFEIAQTHPYYAEGIDERMTIDHSKHSVFGASKVAADVMAQEYGRYFGLRVGIFRCGCLTGPNHSGTQLHGFLAYLIKCVATGSTYSILGYKGKQVRDNIHSFDLVNMFWHFHQNPRPGEVYNAGGGRYSNVSIIEAFEKAEAALGKKAVHTYTDGNRIGDHIWYISDLTKFKTHYPSWRHSYNVDQIIEEICMKGHFR